MSNNERVGGFISVGELNEWLLSPDAKKAPKETHVRLMLRDILMTQFGIVLDENDRRFNEDQELNVRNLLEITNLIPSIAHNDELKFIQKTAKLDREPAIHMARILRNFLLGELKIPLEEVVPDETNLIPLSYFQKFWAEQIREESFSQSALTRTYNLLEKFHADLFLYTSKVNGRQYLMRDALEQNFSDIKVPYGKKTFQSNKDKVGKIVRAFLAWYDKNVPKTTK